MGERKNGGAAFPQIFDTDGRPYNPEPGMSLRDWFAGQSAAALLGGFAAAQANLPPEHAPDVARAAYLLADAMLAEREKQHNA